MRALRARLLALPLLALPVASPAIELETAELETRAAYGRALARGAGTVETSLAVVPRVEVRAGDFSAHAAARFRWDPAEDLEPGEPAYREFGTAAPRNGGPFVTAELRDAWLEWRSYRARVRLGWQQVVWGALDGIKVLDVLAPQRFREFVLEPFEDSRLPRLGAYADLDVDPLRVELAVFPGTTVHQLPEPGAWFELQAPRFRFGASPGATLPPVVGGAPDLDTSCTTLGLRVSGEVGRTDVRAQFVRGPDPEPVGLLQGSGPDRVLRLQHRNRELLGVTASRALGPLAARAEIAWERDRAFNRRDVRGLGEVRHDQLRAGIGVDAFAPGEVFVNVQLVLDRVLDADPGLVRPVEDRILTVTARRAFDYDRFTVEGRWYGGLTDGDGLLRLSTAYALSDDTTLDVTLDAFHGDPEGLFGQFRDRDRLTLSVQHVF